MSASRRDDAGVVRRTPSRTAPRRAVRRGRLAGATACAAALAACAPGGDALPGQSFGVDAPAPLLASRAVDRATLQPVVTLSPGGGVAMARVDGTTRWTGTAQVERSSSVVVGIEWRASFEGRPLALARTERRVDIDDVGAALTLGATNYDYDTGLDADGDGVSNIDELNASTDPFAGPSPDGTPAARSEDAVPVPSEDAGSVPSEDAGSVPSPDFYPVDPQARDDGPAGIVPIDLYVPRISRSDRPRIDGEGVTFEPGGRFGGEWSQAVQVDVSGVPLGIDRLVIDNGADSPDGTPARRWAAMHDGKFLYVVVSVDDDGARVRDSSTIREDDSLEVFLDGNPGRDGAYRDADDNHVHFGLLAPGTTRSPNSNRVETWQPGPSGSGRGLKLDFATGPGIGPDGLRRPAYAQDVYEMRIDLKSAGIETGRPFGFELQVNDDDDGGTRDSKWGWAHPSRGEVDVDFTFVDPSFMGTLLLD